MNAHDVSRVIREKIGTHAGAIDVAEVGNVISVGDSIARVSGVEGAMAGEMLAFPGGSYTAILDAVLQEFATVLGAPQVLAAA